MDECVVTRNQNSILETACALDDDLIVEFGELWARAETLWEIHQDASPFHGYVSADYMAVFESLARLRGRVRTILEWGSGLGVVTIMASRMGFDAFGIEAEAELVTHAETFAKDFGSSARFAHGSFIPDDFFLDRSSKLEEYRTATNAAAAYSQLDLRLCDFDLVYAYPWPKEHSLYRKIIQDCGRHDAMMLTYDTRAGMNLVQFVGDKNQDH